MGAFGGEVSGNRDGDNGARLRAGRKEKGGEFNQMGPIANQDLRIAWQNKVEVHRKISGLCLVRGCEQQAGHWQSTHSLASRESGDEMARSTVERGQAGRKEVVSSGHHCHAKLKHGFSPCRHRARSSHHGCPKRDKKRVSMNGLGGQRQKEAEGDGADLANGERLSTLR